jgi:hypothetical protein
MVVQVSRTGRRSFEQQQPRTSQHMVHVINTGKERCRDIVPVAIPSALITVP